MKWLITTAFVSMAFASTAFAQNAEGTNSSGNSAVSNQPTAADSMMMETWAGETGDMFFTDKTMTTMRGEDELAANWAKLTDAQKETLKGDCKKFGTSTAACTWIAGQN